MFVSQYTYDLTEHIDMDLLHFILNHKEHAHLFKKDTSIEQIRNYKNLTNIQLYYNGTQSRFSRTFFDYDEDIVDDLACLRLVNKIGEFTSVKKYDELNLHFSLEDIATEEEKENPYFVCNVKIGWEDEFLKELEEDDISIDTILNSDMDQLLLLLELVVLPITKIEQAKCYIDLCFIEYIRMKRGVKNV